MPPRSPALRAALGFLQLPPRAPELQLLHPWLDSWTGVGLIAVGLHRQGWDLQFTQYGDGNWRATFYVTGAAHSIVGGSAWEPTPWRAVQRAAWGGAKVRIRGVLKVVVAPPQPRISGLAKALVAGTFDRGCAVTGVAPIAVVVGPRRDVE